MDGLGSVPGMSKDRVARVSKQRARASAWAKGVHPSKRCPSPSTFLFHRFALDAITDAKSISDRESSKSLNTEETYYNTIRFICLLGAVDSQALGAGKIH